MGNQSSIQSSIQASLIQASSNQPSNDAEAKFEKVHRPIPDRYVNPDMNKEVPILRQYCDSESGGNPNDYDCRNLQRVLFRNANYQKHKDDYFFNAITRDILGSKSLEEDTEFNIGYHVNELMEYTQHPAVIADTCHQFSQVCEKYRNGSVDPDHLKNM